VRVHRTDFGTGGRPGETSEADQAASEATRPRGREAERSSLKGGGPFMDLFFDIVELLGKAGW